MGSHYSALIVMDIPHEFDPLDTIEKLTHQKSEVAFEGTYNPGMLLEDCTVAVCKFKNMLFMQGRVLFGRNDDAEFRACLKEVSSLGRLFHWTVEDASGALAFDYIEKGEIKRSWWSCIPQVDIDTGEPLLSEPPGKFSADQRNEHVDEWDLVTVAEGFGFVWDELEDARCTIYRPEKAEKAAVQKPWWRFW